MSDVSRVLIRKRDGTAEPFDLAKLRRSVGAAMRECGYDPRYADALARAVAAHLDQWDQPRAPTTQYVFRCVCAVLRETGLGDAAAAMKECYRRRAANRRRLMVVDRGRPSDPGAIWRKGAIASALRQRYSVSPPTARILAGQIEERVFRLDYDVVSTSLVAELIHSELTAWGLAHSREACAIEEAKRQLDN
jgi:hypothetical protein